MIEVQLDDLNKGDKIRVDFHSRIDGSMRSIEGEFRGFAASGMFRAIRMMRPCEIPGTTGRVTTFIPTRNIEKILRLGR